MGDRKHAVLGAFRSTGAAVALMCVTGSVLGDGPSTQFSLTGAVDRPATYALTDLQALPAITQTVNFLGGGSNQTHTYTGASMWGIVNGAGFVTSSARGDILNKYILATAGDGLRGVLRGHEVDGPLRQIVHDRQLCHIR